MTLSWQAIETLIEIRIRESLISHFLACNRLAAGDRLQFDYRHRLPVKDIAAFHVSVSGYQAMEQSQYARQVAKATGIGLLTYSFHVEAFRCNLPRAIHMPMFLSRGLFEIRAFVDSLDSRVG